MNAVFGRSGITGGLTLFVVCDAEERCALRLPIKVLISLLATSQCGNQQTAVKAKG